jgi:prolipoprotein diacylglyceryl transferase
MHLLAATATLATIPPPPFRSIEVGPLTLHGYGLVLGIALVVAISVCEWALKQQHVDTSRFTPLALLAIAGGFVGARLYHVASEPTRYLEAPAGIVKVWQGGLGIYGAVAGGAIVGLWLAPRFGVARRAMADAAVPALLVGQAIGRLGNYLNQELYGRPFDGPWALEVERRYRPPGFEEVATWHPTFLYEQIGTITLAIVSIVLIRRWRSRPPGILLPLYVSAYSLVRLLVEPLRADAANVWLGQRQNVWVAGALVIAGLVVAAIMYRRDSARRA